MQQSAPAPSHVDSRARDWGNFAEVVTSFPQVVTAAFATATAIASLPSRFLSRSTTPPPTPSTVALAYDVRIDHLYCAPSYQKIGLASSPATALQPAITHSITPSWSQTPSSTTPR